MDAQEDFSALLALFDAHHVEYLVVGAHALAWHGVPRSTGDLHLLVRPSPANVARIIQALIAFGFESLGLTEADFSQPELVVQLGYPPARIDLLTDITGVTWDDAAAGSVVGTLNEREVRFLGRNELVTNKRATGRTRDLADIEALGEV